MKRYPFFTSFPGTLIVGGLCFICLMVLVHLMGKEVQERGVVIDKIVSADRYGHNWFTLVVRTADGSIWQRNEDASVFYSFSKGDSISFSTITCFGVK
jgi:hypothetical protein